MSFIKLIRVNQWIKNGFIFAPLFFSGHLFDSALLLSCFLAFVSYSLTASAIYILNDFKDIEKDKLHPTKNQRPLASGSVSKGSALAGFIVFFLAGLVSAYMIGVSFLYVICFYVVMNILYTFGLKQIAIVDIVIISMGFVLRIIAGGVVTGIEISHWLYIMTFLIALFIAFAKRRDDVLIENETGNRMRQSASGYNLEFISTSLSILSGVLIVSYIMYITSPEIVNRFQNRYAFVSAVFVIVGVLRYMQLAFVKNNTGSPTSLVFKDRFLQITIFLWILFFALLIYIR